MTKRQSNGVREFFFPALAVMLLILSVALSLWIFSHHESMFLKESLIDTSDPYMTQSELEAEKLRQEIRQLEFENQQLNSPWQLLPSYATLITAIVAVSGVFLTIWKQFSERKWDREQREVESRRRMDEKFTAIVADVGSENTSTQVSAIISIMTFLKDEYASFHEQVFLILLANLKVQHKPQVNRLLIQAFAKAIRLYLTSSDCTDRTNRLGEYDFTYTHLYRINLSNLDLSNIDLAFAQMELANLENSNLFRMKGYKANLKKAQFTDANMGEARLAKANLEGAHFHRVNLVSSNLKETNLQKAQFFQAKLQSAHLEKADLNGARFEEADINDAYFYDACFDSSTIKSIRRAYNWEKAHFDDDVFERLNELR